ncbi:MAG TPA: hypothetical protein VNG33_11295 [Polyangiaceae bacterium]|nr:hypothetical protein [Polyangiaceae bacterium]
MPHFDPGVFEDPVANLAGWGPCNTGGASFCTHVLEDRGTERMVFRPTAAALIMYAVLMLLGGGMLAAAVASALALKGQTAEMLLMPLMLLVATLMVGGVGWTMLRKGTRPIVFDRRLGLFWLGRGTPQAGIDGCVELRTIHALQVVAEYCGAKSKFYSYELNLVFANGERSNVVDHGDLARLRRDATALARFLDVELWDAGYRTQR